MESLWQFLLDISANHITRYGLYIPGDPYKLILWNELLVILLTFAAAILALRNRGLERLIARERYMKPMPATTTAPARETRQPACIDRKIALMMFEEVMEWVDFVRIKYIDADGEVTERIIEPLKLYQSGERHYIKAFCHLRGEERSFRLDRIIEMKPVEDDIPGITHYYSNDELLMLSNRDYRL
jgi:hypothetical protein